MSPPRFVRDTAGFAFSQYLSRLVLLVRGIVAARLLGPAAYGSWNALLLVLDYGILTPLGIQQGLDQEIPRTLTAGDEAATRRTKIGGLSGILVAWALFAVGVLVYLLLQPRRLAEGWGVSGVLLMVVGVLLQLVLFYHWTLLRSHGRIGAVSKTISLQAIVAGACGLVLVFPFHMWGMLAGWFVGQIVALVYVRVKGADVAPLGFHLGPETRRLLAIGFPIFLFAGLGAVLKSIDRVMILKYLSTQELGYYSIGLMGVSLLLYLPESLGFVLYPRLIAKFSATRDAAATAAEMERPFATIAWLMPLFVGIAVFWMQPMVELFLPQYLPGLPALSILLFGTLGLALASLPSFYVMAIGKQSRLVPICALAIVLDLVLIGSFLLTGWKIVGVALGVSVGYAVYGLVLTGYAAHQRSAVAAERTSFVARAVLPSVWALVVFFVLHTWVEPWIGARTPRFVAAALSSAVFAGLYAGAARRFAPRTGIVALLRDSNMPGARALAGVWARETS